MEVGHGVLKVILGGMGQARLSEVQHYIVSSNASF